MPIGNLIGLKYVNYNCVDRIQRNVKCHTSCPVDKDDFTVVFRPRDIKLVRKHRRMVKHQIGPSNGKAAGYWDELPGELLKYVDECKNVL